MQSVHSKGRFREFLNVLGSLFLSAGFLVVFAGCAGTPKRPVSDLWELLPGGQSVYFSSGIGENRDLIKSVLKESLKDASMLLATVDRTDSIVLSMHLESKKAPSLDIVASGNFPEALIGWSMFWDRDWEKKNVSREGKNISWWESLKDGLQMSVAKNSLLSVSNGRIEELLIKSVQSAGPVLPDIALETGNRSDFFVYIPNPSEVLTGGLADSRLVLGMNSFWMGLLKAPSGAGTAASTAGGGSPAAGVKPGTYFVQGSFVLRDERAARVYSAIVKITLAAWLNSMGIGNLKTVQEQLSTEISGNVINFSGLMIPEDALRKLVVRFIKDAVPKSD